MRKALACLQGIGTLMTNGIFSQGKKDVVHLFSNIVRRQIGTRTPTVEYISSHPQILFMLLKGYVSHVHDVQCLSICVNLLYSPSMFLLYKYYSSATIYTLLLYLFVNHVFRYESAEVALNCGMMLRECLRHEPLARTVLFSEELYCFFRFVELSTFDIASDAFASFKVPQHNLGFSVQLS